MAAFRPSLELVDDVRAGRVGAFARLISRAEAGMEECRPALAEVYRHTGRAHVAGITGVPGSGKSTLVSELVRLAREDGKKVAVVAIDPTSPFSGGAILGDRIRMRDHSGDSGVYIRSMATRGALGGLARSSFDAVDVLDAAGFDLILLETVGVGQDEVDVVRATHTTVVVSAPGLGDDIQAIKAGVLEIADIHAVSKADRPDANQTKRELTQMLTYSMDKKAAWRPQVIATSSQSGEGIDTLLAAIDRHRRHLHDSGEIEARRQRIAEARVVKFAEDIIREGFEAGRRDLLAPLLQAVVARRIDPHGAAVQLIASINEGTSHDQQHRKGA